MLSQAFFVTITVENRSARGDLKGDVRRLEYLVLNCSSTFFPRSCQLANRLLVPNEIRASQDL